MLVSSVLAPRIKVVLSILVRAVYFASVIFFAFWLGIAVAIGFDSGANAAAVTAAVIYLFTFLPAAIVSFLPYRVLVTPPVLLKIWYGWIILVFIIIAVFRVFKISKVIFFNEKSESGKVCFVLEKTLSVQSRLPHVDIASPNTDFRRFVNAQSWEDGERCATIDISLSPLTVRAYTANENNRRTWKADLQDLPSESVTFDILINRKTCVFIASIEPRSKSEPEWLVRHGSCIRATQR